MRKVRKLRHWKQRFDKNAAFMWRRDTMFNGTIQKAGTKVEDGLIHPSKLRRFWESNRIELWAFEDPNVRTGERAPRGPNTFEDIELPEGVSVMPTNGSWFAVTVPGEDEAIKVNGHKALAEFVASLKAPETIPGGDTVTSDGGDTDSKPDPDDKNSALEGTKSDGGEADKQGPEPE